MVLALEQAKPRQLELPDYIRIFQKRKWFILLITATVSILGGLWAYSKDEVYTASSLVLVQQQPKGFFWVTGREANILPTVALDTYARIARSNDTARLTVERLGALPSSSRIITDIGEVTESIDVTVIPPDLMRIDAQSPDPDKAVFFANFMADSFVHVNTEMRQRESQAASTFIAKQVQKAKEELDLVIQETIDLSRDAGLLEVDLDSNAKAVELRQLEARRRAAGTLVAQLNRKIDELTRQLAGEEEITVTSLPVSNPAWAQVNGQLGLANIELSELRAKYTEEHPVVRDAVARVAELRRTLSQTPEIIQADAVRTNGFVNDLLRRLAAARVELTSAQAEYDMVGGYVASLQAEVDALPEKKQKWRSLTSHTDAMRAVYLNLQQELRQAKLAEAIKQGNAAVVDTATVPRLVKASFMRAVLFATALGLFLGAGLGIVLEALDDTIYSVEDLRRVSDTNFLGVIPLRVDESSELVTVAAPKSPPAEAYRSLRTNIRFALFDSPAQTFMVSSAGTGEGKSLTAANLAVAYAQSGEAVILVDTDLRRPVAHKIFDLESSPGLTNVIVGDHDLASTLKATEVPGLRVLTAGPLPPNPAELLESEHMDQLINDLKQEADIVIFDSPPALMLADAGIMASRIDATILVAESGQITQRALREMERVFTQARANVIGLVLNKLRVTGGDYYYYYYYYYHDYTDGDAGGRWADRRPDGDEGMSARITDVVNNGNGKNGKSGRNDKPSNGGGNGSGDGSGNGGGDSAGTPPPAPEAS